MSSMTEPGAHAFDLIVSLCWLQQLCMLHRCSARAKLAAHGARRGTSWIRTE
jgi:hypothetical protein